jgi:hypothetical protein
VSSTTRSYRAKRAGPRGSRPRILSTEFGANDGRSVTGRSLSAKSHFAAKGAAPIAAGWERCAAGAEHSGRALLNIL